MFLNNKLSPPLLGFWPKFGISAISAMYFSSPHFLRVCSHLVLAFKANKHIFKYPLINNPSNLLCHNIENYKLSKHFSTISLFLKAKLKFLSSSFENQPNSFTSSFGFISSLDIPLKTNTTACQLISGIISSK